MRGAAGSEPSIDGASSSSPGAVAGGGRRGRWPRSSRICARPSVFEGNWQIRVSAQLFWPKFSHLRGRVGFAPSSGSPNH
jgi:hypothetical protein